MGIQCLLRFMKPFIQPVHIGKYSGKRVGIDAYSWLHKGAYSCSMELYLDPTSDASSRYLRYFMHRINLLRHYQVIPVVVFDGGNIPCKSATEAERQKKRDDNLALAKAKLEDGDVNAATELFQRAISITPSMAYRLIQILQSEEVEFIVAPYEADAQLAYLSTLKVKQGGIEAVITEDSDLMAYSCKAIIFKMDRYGKGEEVIMDNVFNSVFKGISFKHFDKELFTGMCVLAGCDFLASIPGIGIKRAYALVSKYRNLDRVLSVIKYEKGQQVPENYAKSFREAVAVFHHAKIYDAENKAIKPIKPLPQKLLQSLDGNLDFLGPEIPSSKAAAIAEGRINPITMETFDDFPNATCHLNTSSRDASDHFPKAMPQLASFQHSCFGIFPVHKTGGRKSSEDVVMENSPNLTDKSYLNEAAGLAKLVSPTEMLGKESVLRVERRACPNNTPFKKRMLRKDVSDHKECTEMLGKESVVRVERRACPNNNPFKRRMLRKDVSGDKECITEQVSILCKPNELNSAPGSDREEAISLEELTVPSELCEELVAEVQSWEFSEANPSKKRKSVTHIPNSTVSEFDQASVITNITNDDDVLCCTLESQASVNSKPLKKAVTGKRKPDKKAKSASSKKNSKIEKDTILSFFNRL
ncbi:exonuclease 1-like [Aristolochia californica]|uniref:exonuclease 1-like n=1 Tax=Aristolochia californica TaxID=171875 RepID=UPI0035D5F4C6